MIVEHLIHALLEMAMPLACQAVSHATKMHVYAMQDTVDHNTLFNTVMLHFKCKKFRPSSIRPAAAGF
jgi:hypothetical protein